MNKRGLDKDMIVSLATISCIWALTILFFVLFLFDISVSSGNLIFIVSSFSMMSGAIWLFLLCRNC